MIEAIAPDREILFTPDMFMGTWLERVTGRKLHVWSGECHVHAGIRPAGLDRWRVRLEAPNNVFEPLREDAVCRYMKMTTLESVRASLERMRHVIAVPSDVAERARMAVTRMVEIG